VEWLLNYYVNFMCGKSDTFYEEKSDKPFNVYRPFETIDHVSNFPIATGHWRASFPDSL
jgi:hypothetical protein